MPAPVISTRSMEGLEKGKVYTISTDDKKMCVNISSDDDATDKNKINTDIAYKIDDIPPWYLCFILGLQHYLTMIGGTVTYPYLIAPHLCIEDDNPARGYLITSTLFVSGICTFLQTTFGVRLPIVQGSSIAFLVPAIAILKLPQWQCPDLANQTMVSENMKDEIWMSRMRQIQGAMIGASLFEVAIGFTGMMGFLLNWITPLAIVPTITLVGLSLFAEAANAASGHWGIAACTMFLLILFSQYLRDVNVPCPTYVAKTGWKTYQFPIFKLFPVLLTITLSWALCVILTTTETLSEENLARTDLKLSALHDTPWFRFPYPGQWGLPTFSTAAIFGVLAGVLASAIESVGDYYACARLSGAPPPPKHAINRGIWMEGIGCVISGLYGTGGGVTSYSENIGAIGITKVASRRVIQFGSLLMICFGMLGKLGALFVTIPEPVIGGIFCVMFSVITSVGLSTLHFVDLNSTRNLFVLGFSIFMGLSIPKWMQANPGVIDTGNGMVDQILTVLSSTSMLVGGLVGFLLDNSIPGTDEERGVLKWKEHGAEVPHLKENMKFETYNVPYMNKFFKKITLFRYLPVSPTYDEKSIISNLVVCRKRLPSKKHSPMCSRL